MGRVEDHGKQNEIEETLLKQKKQQRKRKKQTNEKQKIEDTYSLLYTQIERQWPNELQKVKVVTTTLSVLKSEKNTDLSWGNQYNYMYFLGIRTFIPKKYSKKLFE